MRELHIPKFPYVTFRVVRFAKLLGSEKKDVPIKAQFSFRPLGLGNSKTFRCDQAVEPCSVVFSRALKNSLSINLGRFHIIPDSVRRRHENHTG